MKRFLAGLAAGTTTAGITYAVTHTPPWWWVVGLAVACLAWFGEWLLDSFDDITAG